MYRHDGNKVIRKDGTIICEIKIEPQKDQEAWAKRISLLLNFAEDSKTEDFEKFPPFFSFIHGLSIKNRIMKDLIKHAPKESLERKAAESLVGQTDYLIQLSDLEGRRFDRSPWGPEGYREGLPKND